MKRRDFIKTGAALEALSFKGLGAKPMSGSGFMKIEFPRYRGFNLLAKFGGWGPRRKFREGDFEIMAELGFDFARIPMSYWCWASPD